MKPVAKGREYLDTPHDKSCDHCHLAQLSNESWLHGRNGVKGVERMVGSQPPPACCHASHILFYYIEDCSRGALGE